MPQHDYTTIRGALRAMGWSSLAMAVLLTVCLLELIVLGGMIGP